MQVYESITYRMLNTAEYILCFLRSDKPRVQRFSFSDTVRVLKQRLPRAQLEECFNEYGEVLEVFIIASQATLGTSRDLWMLRGQKWWEADHQALQEWHSSHFSYSFSVLSAFTSMQAASGVGCAFVRMASPGFQVKVIEIHEDQGWRVSCFCSCRVQKGLPCLPRNIWLHLTSADPFWPSKCFQAIC